MTMTLTPVSELDAVNICLRNINESPVNSLNSLFGDALMANQMLHETSRKIQSIGLVCNTDYDFDIEPTAEEYSDVTPQANEITTLVLSGDTAYSEFNGEYTFEGDVDPNGNVTSDYWSRVSGGNLYIILPSGSMQVQDADSVGPVTLRYWTTDSQSINGLPPLTGWREYPIPSGTVATFTLEYSTDTYVSGGGEILLPDNTLKVLAKDYNDKDLIERGRKLYDRLNHTYNINDTVTVDLIRFLSWEELPQVVRNYITVHTARNFQVQVVGDSDNYMLTEKDEAEAKAEFLREQVDVEQANFLTGSHSVFDVMFRTRQHPVYSIF